MKRTVRKLEIDERVATMNDLSRREMSLLSEAFFNEVMIHLVDGHEVYIPGFGTFHAYTRKGKRASTARLNRSSDCRGNKAGETVVVVRQKIYVSFRRARGFKDRFQEKYGKQKVVGHGG